MLDNHGEQWTQTRARASPDQNRNGLEDQPSRAHGAHHASMIAPDTFGQLTEQPSRSDVALAIDAVKDLHDEGTDNILEVTAHIIVGARVCW